MASTGTIYRLHVDRAIGDAARYWGSTTDLGARVAEHAAGAWRPAAGRRQSRRKRLPSSPHLIDHDHDQRGVCALKKQGRASRCRPCAAYSARATKPRSSPTRTDIAAPDTRRQRQRTGPDDRRAKGCHS